MIGPVCAACGVHVWVRVRMVALRRSRTVCVCGWRVQRFVVGVRRGRAVLWGVRGAAVCADLASDPSCTSLSPRVVTAISTTTS